MKIKEFVITEAPVDDALTAATPTPNLGPGTATKAVRGLTGLGRAAAHGFNTGVQNVGGNAVDRLQTNVFTPKSTIPNIGYTVPAAAGATAKPAVAQTETIVAEKETVTV